MSIFRRMGGCPPLTVALLTATLLGGSLSSAGTAAADNAPPPPAQTERVLLARVQALQVKTDAALKRYDAAMTQMASGVTASRQATTAQRAAEQAAEQAQTVLDEQVLALYISGGRAGLYSSMIGTEGLEGFAHRAALLQRVASNGRRDAADSAVAAGVARTAADSARRQAFAGIKTAGQVGDALAAVETLLDQQQRLLSAADVTVRQMKAMAALRAAQAAAALITSSAGRRVGPMPASAEFFRLYHSAATTCPGLSWTVLAAIGQVETGHGRNMNTSSAGAQGPMQFMPTTFARYGVDGDRDGRIDIMNPADAIYSAAHYLCANQAGTGPAGLRQAVWHYNHADWYVDMVLALAARYAAGT